MKALKGWSQMPEESQKEGSPDAEEGEATICHLPTDAGSPCRSPPDSGLRDWVDEMPPMTTGSLGGGSGLENLLRFKLVMPVTWRWTCPAAEGVALREGLAHDN